MLLYWKEILTLKHRYVTSGILIEVLSCSMMYYLQVEVDFDFVEALNTGRISSPSFTSTRQIFPEMDYVDGVDGRYNLCLHSMSTK